MGVLPESVVLDPAERRAAEVNPATFERIAAKILEVCFPVSLAQ